MAEFKADKIVTVKVGDATLKINQRIIPDSAVANKNVAVYIPKGAKIKPCAKISGTGRPKGICVHNTEYIKNALYPEDLAKQYSLATWPNCNMGGTVVHYYVHKNNIWKLLEDSERGWHAADGSSRKSNKAGTGTIGGNLDCIAIECVGENIAGSVVTGEETTAKLCAYLCALHGLEPMKDIYTHNYFYPKKKCPAYIIGHWDSFLARVQYWYAIVKDTNTVSPTLKYSVGDVLLIKKGSKASRTPDGANSTRTDNAKYGTCKEAITGAKHPYKIGAYYYQESACSIYNKKPTKDVITKGTKITLKDANLYGTAAAATASKKVSGTYYIYDGKIFGKDRIRICPDASNVGATPIGKNVTGYIDKDDII